MLEYFALTFKVGGWVGCSNASVMFVSVEYGCPEGLLFKPFTPNIAMNMKYNAYNNMKIGTETFH